MLRSFRPVAGLALASLCAATACDFPTAPPRFETRFVVPVEPTRIAIGELLPAGVTETPERDAFSIDVPGFALSRTLGEMCSECALANGLTLPKPAFTFELSRDLELPAELIRAEVVEGGVRVSLANDLGFDPLRPGSGSRGTLELALSAAGREIAHLLVRGEDTGFPSGSTLTRTLEVAPGEVTEPLVFELTLDSPEGDPVRIESERGLGVEVEPLPFLVAEVEVRLAEQAVEVAGVPLDATNVDPGLVERVRGGAVDLETESPWAVSGTLTLRLDGIVRSVEVAPGTRTQRMELSEEEIRGILGREVTLTAEGSLSATGGSILLRPGQELTISPRLLLEVELGGLPEEGA